MRDITTQRVYERLEQFHGDVTKLRLEMAELRAETRGSFLDVESDMVSAGMARL
jgi:hypothetical protein